MLRLGKALQVLSVVVLCAVYFGTAAFAEREAPRGKAPKAEASKPEASKEGAKQRVELHRPGKPGGKCGTTKTLGSSFDKGCSASCNDAICVCYYDWWDEGCCDYTCSYCWMLMG